MEQPAPKISAADVERVLVRDFPPEAIPAVRAALAEYGTKAWHAEPDRVHLAILKIADGHPDRLPAALALADQDFRDVLCAAEYPRYAAEISPLENDGLKRRLVINDDWHQYRAWVEKKKS